MPEPLRELLLFRHDAGLGYSVHSRRDQYRAGTSVVKADHFSGIDDAYINGIRAMSNIWAPHISIRAGVPDDADQARHPVPLSELELLEVLNRIG